MQSVRFHHGPPPLLDDLVRARQHRGRDGKTESLGVFRPVPAAVMASLLARTSRGPPLSWATQFDHLTGLKRRLPRNASPSDSNVPAGGDASPFGYLC